MHACVLQPVFKLLILPHMCSSDTTVLSFRLYYSCSRYWHHFGLSQRLPQNGPDTLWLCCQSSVIYSNICRYCQSVPSTESLTTILTIFCGFCMSQNLLRRAANELLAMGDPLLWDGMCGDRWRLEGIISTVIKCQAWVLLHRHAQLISHRLL